MASSPYHSKVLRFVRSQVRSLRYRAAQTWGWTQVSVVWGVQIATAIAAGSWQWTRRGWHQIWALAQGIESRLKLIDATQAEGTLPPIPSTDIPICQVLTWAEEAFPTTLSQRRLATDLATGRLAWVAQETQEVLNEQEHHIVHRRIVYELAAHGYWQKQTSQRKSLILWHVQRLSAQTLAWIWQAVLYFFDKGRGQAHILPHQSNASLPLAAEPGSLMAKGQSLWPRNACWENTRIFHRIQQAIYYFFGPVGHNTLEPRLTPLHSSGTLTLSLAILPGILGWGSSVVVWVRRTLRRWVSGIGLAMYSDSGATHLLQNLPGQVPSANEDRAIAPSTRLDSLISSGPQTATLPISTSVAPSATCLDVPATVIGYDQSLLVWLLTWVDKVLVWLEQLVVSIWHRLQTWLDRDR